MDEAHMKAIRALAMAMKTGSRSTAAERSPRAHAAATQPPTCREPELDPRPVRARSGPRLVVSATGWRHAVAGLSLWALLVVAFVGTVGWSAPGANLESGRRQEITVGETQPPLAQPAAVPASCGHTAAHCPCSSA